MILTIAIILSYLLGSIPTAYIYGRVYKGIDIREHGSGNVGATNVFRVLGKGPGIIVLLIDILKGVLAVAGVSTVLSLADILHYILLGFAVVAGHNWTIFLKFKGGKGVATSLGVLIGLTLKIPSIQIVLLITLGSWIVVFIITRLVSLASMIAAVILAIAMVATDQPLPLICLGSLFCVFVIFRHRPNIDRLLKGEEPKVPSLWPFSKHK
ncbi:MAG: glycerol-3-phosphate 1-O-acyltransferase PlsY [Candidatus Omnitrophica bacterium]|nr:glycerol-3-phosphate 1-O-acyltransferase PlsY [Candidatus Omnitrophota bacterium]